VKTIYVFIKSIFFVFFFKKKLDCFFVFYSPVFSLQCNFFLDERMTWRMYTPFLDLFFVKCVAVCCSVLQCVAVCCSVLQCVAVRCSMLQRVAVCCSALQCVAVRCHVLQWIAVGCNVLQCVAMCCSPFLDLLFFREGLNLVCMVQFCVHCAILCTFCVTTYIYIYKYIFMYVYMYISIYIYIHILHIHAHVCLHYTYVCMYI